MVEPGEAVTTLPLEALNPVAGDHVNVVAPLAVRVVVAPAQMVAELTVIVGLDTTLTLIVSVAVQLPSFTVTV
jgi:hypothetical protein